MKKYLLLIIMIISTNANSQINSDVGRTPFQLRPFLMSDLSKELLYNDAIVKLGYHTMGKNNQGGIVYTNNVNEWIVYGPTKNNGENTIYSSMYFTKEVDNIDPILVFLDGFNDENLYDQYGLEPEDGYIEGYSFVKNKPNVLQVLENKVDKAIDRSKYYISDRMEKNYLTRGIRLINKTAENGEVKPYYLAIVYIASESPNYAKNIDGSTNNGSNIETSQKSLSGSESNLENQSDNEELADEYTEAEFQGEDEVELAVSNDNSNRNTSKKTYKIDSSKNINSRNIINYEYKPLKKYPKSPLGIVEKNMIGKWYARNNSMWQFYYGKLEMYAPGKRMIDCHWNLNQGVAQLSAWGIVINKFKVVYVSKTKAIWVSMDGKNSEIILTR